MLSLCLPTIEKGLSMKNKLFTALVALVAVFTLAACSNNTKKTETSSSSEATSKNSKSEASSSNSTEASSSVAPASEVTYMTDEEIDAIATLGEYKAAFKSLTEAYVADFEALIAEVPSAAKEVLTPTRDQLVKTFDEQYKTVEEQLAQMGSDATAIPEVAKESLLSAVKTMRDQLKQAMETAREQAASFLN